MKQNSMFVLCLLVAGYLFAPLTSLAQTSVGYSNPQDTSTLLDYRLPDWSYRDWRLGFGLEGEGFESRSAGSTSADNSFRGRLETRFDQTWESENRDLYFGAELTGNYSNQHDGTDSFENSANLFRAHCRLSSHLKQYLGKSDFFADVSGRTYKRYKEYALKSGEKRYTRYTANNAGVGLGWGRLRNVGPLLRAQRLSERLVGLGKPQLTKKQVQKIAKVLAKQTGYWTVFDRVNRHFWNDVLTPMLGENNSLSPLEIYYLADVMDEDLGIREQGFELRVQYTYYEDNYDGSTNRFQRYRIPTIEAKWSHNISLTRQIQISGLLGYEWKTGWSRGEDSNTINISFGHYWNVSDRFSWDAKLSGHNDNNILPYSTLPRIGLNSTFRFYLENKVSLTANVQFDHIWDEDSLVNDSYWQGVYGLGLEYHLGRLVF